jgi:hypothetical protein
MRQLENKNTAWFDNDILPNEMVKGATGENGWLRLEETPHFKVLNKFICDLNIDKMADVGCGAGELGRVLSKVNYTGFDLPHIIDKVSMVVNPNQNYHYFNANDFDYTKLKEFNLIVCNGFISELINPIEVLNKIITNTSEYFLIHRQFFSDETKFSEYKTYGDLNTIRTHIGFNDFKKLLNNHEIIKRETNEWGDTMLIKKIN